MSPSPWNAPSIFFRNNCPDGEKLKVSWHGSTRRGLICRFVPASDLIKATAFGPTDEHVVTFWNRIPIASCYQKLGCGMCEVITSTSKWVCLLGNMTRLKVGSLDPSYHTFSMSSRDTMGCPSAWSSMCRGAGQRYCRKSLVAQLRCLLSQGHWQLKLSRNSLDADEHYSKDKQRPFTGDKGTKVTR